MAKQEIIIGNKIIKEGSKPYLIAEIGINHNGDMQIAKALMDAAFACNWDCVKFQKRNPDVAVPEAQKNVMRDTPWGRMTYLEYKKHVEFEKEQYDYIDKYCLEKPLDWTASPWDMDSLRFLLNYDIPFIKIASATLTNDELLVEASKSGKAIVISTGMSTIDEIDHAVEILENYSDGNYILMHTNSTYPTDHDDINLNMIKSLRDRYKCLVGYSGHEQDLEPSVAAVVVGAVMIERHVTLSHELWGTDQAASLTVPAMGMLEGRIKNIRSMMGNGEKILSEKELQVRKKLRG
jgi:N-acetylneuraminate synthase